MSSPKIVWRQIRQLPTLVAILLGGLAVAQAQVSAPLFIHGPGVNPEGFRITTFASGMKYPVGMAQLKDGSLLVAISEGASYFSSTGKLLRLTDTNSDGIADNAGTTLYAGLVGGLTSVRVNGDLVFVTGQGNNRPISILRMGTSPASPLTLLGQITLKYPTSGWEHPHSALAVRPSPGLSQGHDLLFQVGSQFNAVPSTGTVGMSSTNIPGANATLQGDSIYRITIVEESASGVSATNLTRLASGLRNPAGFAFHPISGDLYFEDNGIDGLVDANEPRSADEINTIAAAALGGEVEFFGFPDNFTTYRTGVVAGGQGIQPIVAFQPQPDPLTGEESEGPNDITFAPPGFPDGLNNGIFVAFHGKFSLGGAKNEENPLVFVELTTTNYFHFTSARQANIGHLDGLLASGDSLFVSDIAANGSLSTGSGTGMIYQIKSMVLPSVRASWKAGKVELNWSFGTLQKTSGIPGAWDDVPGATSPFTVEPGAERAFFRTRN